MTRKTSNRFEMLNHFCDETCGSVSRFEGLVWLIAYRWARLVKGRPGLWEASVSQRQIAQTLGSNQAAVSRAVQALLAKGLLVRTKDGSKTWKSSRYFIYPDVDSSRCKPPK